MSLLTIYGAFINDKIIYVGQTINFKRRVQGHQMRRKYGYDNVDFVEIFKDCTQEEADCFERQLIKANDLVNNGENKSIGGKRGGSFKMSQEGRDKISRGLKGKPKSKEHIANMPTKFKKGIISWNIGTVDVMKANSGSFKLGKPFYIIKDGEILGRYEVQAKCAYDYGLRQSYISRVLTGERKTCKGFTFRYTEEFDADQANRTL
jgi:hypothetical protein